jgi:malonyl CoA-acyl carrier protein transacylase
LAHRRGGGAFTAADLRGDNAVLVFLGADCPPCRALADDLRAARPPYLPSTLVLVVDEGREATAVIEGIDTEVIYQHGREVSQAFNSSATPHAFVIDRGGTVVATGTPNTLSALRELVVSLKREEVSRRSQEHSVVSA